MSKIRKEVKKLLIWTLYVVLLMICAFSTGYRLGYGKGMSIVTIAVDQYTYDIINTTGVSCADVLYEGCL